MALVPQGKMTKAEFQTHKKRCTVQPNAHLQGKDKYKYGKPDPPFDVYRVTDKGLIFPKYYAIDNIKNSKHIFNEGQPIDIQFNGSLRPHQLKSIECIEESYRKSYIKSYAPHDRIAK